MIACPKCGGSTAVLETRSITAGIRRRRGCASIGCDGRLTTVETPVSGHGSTVVKDVVLVNKQAFERALSALSKLAALRSS